MTPANRCAACLVPLAAVLAGCAGPTVWEQSFSPAPEAAVSPAPKDAPVRLRQIPWERMRQALTDLEQEAATGDVPPEEWPPARKSAVKERLLRSLQATAPPEGVEVVGRSEFRTTDAVRPDGADAASLEAFARRVGATDVVWSTRVLGRTAKIVDKPVTTYGTTTWYGSRRGRDRWWGDTRTDSSTTWVPMSVPADETGVVAFYLRQR